MDDVRVVNGEGGPVEYAKSITLAERMQRIHDAEEHAGCPVCQSEVERVTEATPRPWSHEGGNIFCVETGKIICGYDLHAGDIYPEDEDASLIVAAVNACHELGIEPENLVARVRGLEAADKLTQIGLDAATQVYQERDQLQARVTALERLLHNAPTIDAEYDHDPEYWKERLLLEQGERKVLEAEVERLRGQKQGRPVVVCLCGSTRFMDAFHEAGWRETLDGKIVLSVGLSKYAETPDGGHLVEILGRETAEALDELHKRKIDLADEVLILNVGGYIGESTFSELLYAWAHGKSVRWLEPTLAPQNEAEARALLGE